MRLFIISIAALGLLTACEQGSAAPDAAAPVAAITTTAASEPHVHRVACGCSLGQSCSNMVEVDGEYVPLTGDLDLGPMAFCGKRGLKAQIAGELKDGAFVATSFELIEDAK
jgi:hypothetical protein